MNAPAGFCTAGSAGAFAGHRTVSETCEERKHGLLHEVLHWDPGILASVEDKRGKSWEG